MNELFRHAIPTATIAFCLLGCSSSEETATKSDVEQAAAEAEAQNKNLESSLSKGIADVQESVDASQDKMQTQLEEQKAALMQEMENQKAALVEQFQASNDSLADKVESLRSKYEKMNEQLPAEVSKQVDTKIAKIVTSLQNLQSLVKNFDPNSIEQINTFKEKYQKELSIAQDLVAQAMQILEATDLDLPKLP